MSDEHQAFIKTPKQLIAVVVLSFVIPIVLIIMMASYVGSGKLDGAGSDALTTEAIARRIAPVAGLELADASGSGELASGKAVYEAQCAACHAAGVAGAPKFADTAAWEPRLGQGYDALLQSVLNGKGAMAAQGGGKYSDLEIGRAVVYMANEAGGNFEEPAEPAAADAAATEKTETAAADATAKAEPASTDAAATEKAEPAAGTAATAAAAAAAPAAAPAPAAEAPAASDSAPAEKADGPDLAAGKILYDTVCTACHAAGIAGAPKFGDAAAWEGRSDKSIDELTATVISGKGAMPPRGGSTASDQELKASVAYMMDALK